MPINNPTTGGGTVTIGTTAFSGGTTGSVLFIGAASVVQQDNANFFWDDTNNRFSLGNAGAVPAGQTALVSGDYLVVGASSGSTKNAIIFNNQGLTATPSAADTSSVGDKIVFWNAAGFKSAINLDDNAGFNFQSTGSDSQRGWRYFSGTTEVARLTRAGAFSVRNAFAVATSQTALTAGDVIILGNTGTSSASDKTNIIFNNHGFAAPSNSNASSNGDKLVFWNDTGVKTSIGMTTNKGMTFQAVGASTEGFLWHSANTGTTAQVMSLSSAGLLTLSNATLLATNVALTNGAGASAGTMTNAPAAGNPTKWIPINDNGTTRYIPAW